VACPEVNLAVAVEADKTFFALDLGLVFLERIDEGDLGEVNHFDTGGFAVPFREFPPLATKGWGG